jgi:hypothetical protein
MKSHKSQRASHKSDKKVTLKKLSKYIDKEVTLIHENLEELKNFLGEHAAMQNGVDLHADHHDIDRYYDSANDLFKQIALENGEQAPIEAKFYETLVLKKKKKNSDLKDEASS